MIKSQTEVVPAPMEPLFDWILLHRSELELLGLISLAAFVVTLIALPLAVVYLPEDYFVRDRRKGTAPSRRHPLAWFALAAMKNVLGVLFVLAGLAMLVLPGQGLLTIAVGLTLMNFPGKYRLERRFVRQSVVRKALDRIRARAGKPPLRL